jgi:integrase
MTRRVKPLTKLTVDSLLRGDRLGYHRDAGCRGLYLLVTSPNAASWVFRYMIRGRRGEMGLGSARDIGLAKAREIASKAREDKAQGIDPLEARKAVAAAMAEEARLLAAKAIPFREAAQRYIAQHEASWKNEKHRAQWSATLSLYAYPVIGSLPVGEVGVDHILKILDPIWHKKPETASRLRGRIEKILDWAEFAGLRSGRNPARWKGHLSEHFPQKAKIKIVRHQPAMPYGDVPGFMAELRAMESVSARALEFTILTASRTSAVTGAGWEEIDLMRGIWTIPKSRAGTKLTQDEHRVPLSGRALEIIRGLSRIDGNPHLFTGAVDGLGLSNMAMLELLQGRYPQFTVHGFRSSFKDWASEATNFPNTVSEMALAHVVKGAVEAAYRRGDLFEKRRKLMDAWAGYCSRSPATALVIPMKPAEAV